MELRYLERTEIRSVGSGKKIAGYAAVFDVPADIDGQFMEVVRPGAFARATSGDSDVRALFNHKPSEILGRTKNGTLRLAEDETGLAFEIDLPDTSLGHDILELVARGDITGCSFGFVPVKQRWAQGGALRELLDVTLLDVSPVTFPAYSGTSVAVRSARDAAQFSRVGSYTFVRKASIHVPVPAPTPASAPLDALLETDRRRDLTRLIGME